MRWLRIELRERVDERDVLGADLGTRSRTGHLRPEPRTTSACRHRLRSGSEQRCATRPRGCPHCRTAGLVQRLDEGLLYGVLGFGEVTGQGEELDDQASGTPRRTPPARNPAVSSRITSTAPPSGDLPIRHRGGPRFIRSVPDSAGNVPQLRPCGLWRQEPGLSVALRGENQRPSDRWQVRMSSPWSSAC